MSESFLQIDTFEEAIDYIMDEIGSDFAAALRLANTIIDAPQDYTGPQAALAAARLSAYRYKIGNVAQVWKAKSSTSKKLSDRLIKDSLMVSYDGLLEVVNTLKLIARADNELAK